MARPMDGREMLTWKDGKWFNILISYLYCLPMSLSYLPKEARVGGYVKDVDFSFSSAILDSRALFGRLCSLRRATEEIRCSMV